MHATVAAIPLITRISKVDPDTMKLFKHVHGQWLSISLPEQQVRGQTLMEQRFHMTSL
jgi:hypothetical protein